MKNGSTRTLLLGAAAFAGAVGVGLILRWAGPDGASILMGVGGLVVLGLLVWGFTSGRRGR